MPDEIPLFPLSSVLFPGGVLPLRIFEPRYLSMVGQCMKNDSVFGVVLIEKGNEAGEAATFYPIGTTARIIDFDQLKDGTLGLTCQGEHIFQVESHQVQEDQLITGTVELNTVLSTIEKTQQHQALINFLQTLAQRKELKDYFDALNQDWRSLYWISYRLSELLPMTNRDRQQLLEMTLEKRLSKLFNVMKKHNLVT